MNKETKEYIIALIINLLLLCVAFYIDNVYLINIDMRSYYFGVLMTLIFFLTLFTKSIIKKIIRWLDE